MSRFSFEEFDELCEAALSHVVIDSALRIEEDMWLVLEDKYGSEEAIDHYRKWLTEFRLAETAFNGVFHPELIPGAIGSVITKRSI